MIQHEINSLYITYSANPTPLTSYPSPLDQLIIRLAFSTLNNISSAKEDFNITEKRLKDLLPMLSDVECGMKLTRDSVFSANQVFLQNAILDRIEVIIRKAWRVNDVIFSASQSSPIKSDSSLDFISRCLKLANYRFHHDEHDVFDIDSTTLHQLGNREPEFLEDYLLLFKHFNHRLDLNIRTRGGNTPLIESWNLECIKLLVAAGADVNAVSASGITRLDIAEGPSIAAFLMECGGKSSEEATKAAV